MTNHVNTTNHTTRPPSFDARVMAYLPGLKNLAYKLERDPEIRGDLVTDTLIEALDKWQNFRGDGGMWNWLYWMMRGKLTNQRNKKKAHLVEEGYRYENATTAPRQHDYSELSSVLGQLTDRAGGVLIRRAMGETLAEIGKDIGVGVERTRQLEEKARARLVKWDVEREAA